MLFHHSFLKILRGEDPLEHISKNLTKDFKSINFDVLPKTTITIKQIAPILLDSIKCDQELLKSTDDYYVARDISTNVIYICFKELLMIDIDQQKNSQTFTDNSILDHFNFPDKCFHIFKSNNGYHVFCISQPFIYRNEETSQFMLDNFCDFYYCVFSYIRGFSVRLNKKFNEYEVSQLYIDLGVTGNKESIDPRLQTLVHKHISLVNKYKDTLNIN